MPASAYDPISSALKNSFHGGLATFIMFPSCLLSSFGFEIARFEISQNFSLPRSQKGVRVAG